MTASGGKVLGSVRHPLSTSDFSSYLLQAQASKAKIIGLASLKAVQALKDKDPAKVMAWMKANPTDDVLFGKGKVRADGRKIHEMYLFEVKKPSESKGDWDLYKLVATIPANEAFRPLNEGGCPLVTD